MANQEPNLESIRNSYPPILTTAQVAELLGLNVRTVMVMANDGRLPASRLPGSRKYHFVLEDVLATLARHRIQPEPAAAATATRRASTASLTAKGEGTRTAGAAKAAKSAAATKRSASKSKATRRSTS